MKQQAQLQPVVELPHPLHSPSLQLLLPQSVLSGCLFYFYFIWSFKLFIPACPYSQFRVRAYIFYFYTYRCSLHYLVIPPGLLGLCAMRTFDPLQGLFHSTFDRSQCYDLMEPMKTLQKCIVMAFIVFVRPLSPTEPIVRTKKKKKEAQDWFSLKSLP